MTKKEKILYTAIQKIVGDGVELSQDKIHNQRDWFITLARKALADYHEYDDPCPECGTELVAQNRGGVKCPKCSYWFCF